MHTCSEISALLPLHVGDDLEAPLAAGVRAHLDTGCAACSAALSDLARTRDALRELEQRSPAPQVDLWPAVQAALRAEGQLEAAPRRALRPVALGRGGVWLRAAAVLIAAGGIFYGLRPSPAPLTPADNLADSGVTTELTPTLVSGPQSADLPLGGLRRLEPGEAPFFTNARLYGVGQPRGMDDMARRRALKVDPSRPTLAGDRLR